MSLRLNADTCGKEIEISKLRSAKIHVLPSTEHLMPAQKAEEKRRSTAVLSPPTRKIISCNVERSIPTARSSIVYACI